MKKLLLILRPPKGLETEFAAARTLWRVLAITALGCAAGLLTMALAATAYLNLPGWPLFLSYFHNPLIPALNLLPPVLLIWAVFFLTRRAWIAFPAAFIPVVGISLVNYFKIRLRSDPLLAADLKLAAEAGGIVGGYTLDLTWLVWFSLFSLIAGTLFAFFLIPKGEKGWQNRAFGALACLAMLAAAFQPLYLSDELYQRASNEALINPRSDVESYLSRGCVYPFLHTFGALNASRPEDYVPETGAALLAQFPDGDIPEDQKVHIMGIMLEAFCDLTDYPALAAQESVAEVYAPWHALEEQSVTGDLLTNIFAGGTVDSEWAFLTGYTTHGDFVKPTDSYVWYLRDQGYQTFGSHPGFGWFYDRENINQYLGFEEYWFTENHYGALVDPVAAQWHSDPLLAKELLAQLEERTRQGPCFSFSVAYQNHGPYDTNVTSGKAYLTPANSGMGQESCNIINNYLGGLSETIGAMTGLADGLAAMEEPVVLVLFGDHKPWLGNGNSAYTEAGVTFDLSTTQGFYDYYSTPYLIWANDAAKAALGSDFTGDGGDFSPCFLMTELFDLCGWEGPAFLQMSRDLRAITPLVHTQNLYWREDELTETLPEESADFLSRFLSAQYYREQEIDPTQ